MMQLSLKAKLWSALALMWLGLLILGGWAAWHERGTVISERRSSLENIVSTADGIVRDYAEQAAAGKIGDRVHFAGPAREVHYDDPLTIGSEGGLDRLGGNVPAIPIDLGHHGNPAF